MRVVTLWTKDKNHLNEALKFKDYSILFETSLLAYNWQKVKFPNCFIQSLKLKLVQNLKLLTFTPLNGQSKVSTSTDSKKIFPLINCDKFFHTSIHQGKIF